jgi:hypothetical protein
VVALQVLEFLMVVVLMRAVQGVGGIVLRTVESLVLEEESVLPQVVKRAEEPV